MAAVPSFLSLPYELGLGRGAAVSMLSKAKRALQGRARGFTIHLSIPVFKSSR